MKRAACVVLEMLEDEDFDPKEDTLRLGEFPWINYRNEAEVPDRYTAEVRATEDLLNAIGKIFKVTVVYGYEGERSGSSEISASRDKPFFVRVIGGDARHWRDNFLDPYWEVESTDPRLSHVRSMWVFGQSYFISEANT